jgi:hypothetical protein
MTAIMGSFDKLVVRGRLFALSPQSGSVLSENKKPDMFPPGSRTFF